MDGHWSKGSVIAVLAGVWATFALDVFSTLNSSPQTTELFAGEREGSLMHWVWIGDIVAIVGGAIASILSRKWTPVAAVVGVVGGLHYLYQHAVRRGKGQAPPASSDDGARTGRPRG